jgi:Zinc-binding domain of primase-helicase
MTVRSDGGAAPLRDQMNRENALELLRDVACPACGSLGDYQLFDELNNNGVGLQCRACSKHHPFIKQGIMWLRTAGKRRSNDIAAVMKERGAYCYGCGTPFRVLEAHGIGMHAHHSRPFTAHGEDSPKIPLCALCHEIITALQRTMRRLLERDDAPALDPEEMA